MGVVMKQRQAMRFGGGSDQQVGSWNSNSLLAAHTCHSHGGGANVDPRCYALNVALQLCEKLCLGVTAGAVS